MKIFNWMRRRFTDEKGESVENVKKEDYEINYGSNNDENDNYNKCLLNDQWRGDYLLTIGTFGVLLDPLEHYYNMNQQPKQCPNHYNILDKDIEIIKEEEEKDEIQESYDDGLGQDNAVISIINVDDQTAALIKMKKMEADDAIINDDDDANEKMMKKERITLADLFYAESAGMLMENVPPLPLPLSLPLLPLPPPEVKPAAIPPPPPPMGKEHEKKKLTQTSPVKQISQPIQKVKLTLKPELCGGEVICQDHLQDQHFSPFFDIDFSFNPTSKFTPF